VLGTPHSLTSGAPGIGHEIADVAVDHSEQRDDRGLVGGDRIEIAHRGHTFRLTTLDQPAQYIADKCGLRLHQAGG
jgi:hypothetical protein